MIAESLWTSWSYEPGLVIPLGLSAALYVLGTRGRKQSGTWRAACFWSGWIALAGALISPLHALGESLFAAHMVQHEILMLIAAPLLVLSRPLTPFLFAMPLEWRRTAGRWSKSTVIQATWSALTRPANAWLIHAAALWIWHLPPLFQATLGNEWIHAAQHSTFFGSALLFWWSLFYGRGHNSYGPAVLYVFATGVHTGILGALLTLSTGLWYPAYKVTTAAWGLTPLQDQQLGGVIMWVPASLVYLGSGLALFSAWLRNSARTDARGLYAN